MYKKNIALYKGFVIKTMTACLAIIINNYPESYFQLLDNKRLSKSNRK